MPKLNLIIPNPDGSGRYSVYDPTAGRYVRGGINVSRMEAEQLVRDVRPQHWSDLARAAGWLPPDEVAKRLEQQADLTEAALADEAGQADEPEQHENHEARVIDSIDEL